MQTTQMKKLTKIRLINWHYFTDETIPVVGSALFSGENASGKSTVLDAIQLVLTTNSTRFNPAANQRSKRDLRGYVRCKTGEEGNTYVRSHGSVISYVALEFYEESKDHYFVLGVKLDSQDVDAEIYKKWFVAEGPLDTLTFIVDGKPALDKEFTQNGKRIQFENQVGRARDNFRVRLGRLDDTFRDMVIKSLAFKPMDHVKDFINQFILPKNVIRTEVLQENIRSLRELQKLISDVKQQIAQLKAITREADEIESIDGKILVVDILLAIATYEHEKQQLLEAETAAARDERRLASLKESLAAQEQTLAEVRNTRDGLKISMANNDTGRLIEKLEDTFRTLGVQRARLEEDDREYRKQVNLILSAGAVLLAGTVLSSGKASSGGPAHSAGEHIGVDKSALHQLQAPGTPTEERVRALEELADAYAAAQEKLYKENAAADNTLANLTSQIRELEGRISQLKKNRPVYDANTTGLMNAINEEFASRGITSEARIFADLLEMEMPEWRDAVEGYLHTQRLNILVEPQYYDIAAEVYDRMKAKLHSVGLVNIGAILREKTHGHGKDPAKDKSRPAGTLAEADRAGSRPAGTLAEAVRSDNRYARAYADYLLGRVVRCDKVGELKQHSIAITKECMKYQGHVLTKIRPDIYKTPYIGRGAIRIQLENAERDLADIRKQKAEQEAIKKDIDAAIQYIRKCDFNKALSAAGAGEQLREVKARIEETERDLKDAKANPTFIELGIRLTQAEQALKEAENKHNELISGIAVKERDIEEDRTRIAAVKDRAAAAELARDELAQGSALAYAEAEARYRESTQTRSAGTIAENYGPRKKTLSNQREKAVTKLIELQAKYKDGDFGTGTAVMDQYREDLEKLERGDLISYEDRLASAQEDCELEFRENFLAKMRENIERAETIFTQLNRSLKGIYYGNDSYRFELSANRERQSLYDMITSDINIAGQTLFSSVFEERYHAEMEDLFATLTDENLADSKVIDELTDYRSYLDYDIQIIDRDGKMQRFSKTYGEKSGGETQTPYYVAIAASFAQMYSGRETVRILMLDEAFNNMDEDHIESMMQFFRAQNFQVILAAPPSRMETIGEYVDSIFLAIHKGRVSTIEEYYL